MAFQRGNLRAVHPVEKFIQWHNADQDTKEDDAPDGYWAYWDKKEKKQVVVEDKYLEKIIIIDIDLFTIVGFNESTRRGIYSNEVRTVEDKLTVKYGGKQKDTLAVGSYSQIKEKIKAQGGKYARSAYVMLPLLNNELVNIQLAGGAFSEWMEDVESLDQDTLLNKYIGYTGYEKRKKGKNIYYVPKFKEGKSIPEDKQEIALAKYNLLGKYLETYLKRGAPADGEDTEEEVDDSFADKSDKNRKSSRQLEELNTDNWRVHNIDGANLYECDADRLKEIKGELEAAKQEDSDDYQFVCRAIYEWQQAEKNWKKYKLPNGSVLGSMTIEQINKSYANCVKSAPTHEARLFMEAAIIELSPDEDEEDDIPF